jgi:uncharacterized protein (TIGR01777 family)
MRLVIAGGNGFVGRRIADHFGELGHEVMILTRSPRLDVEHRQLLWDGQTAGDWATELAGAVLVNLAGELVDRPPTKRNIDLLRRSRVAATRALVSATSGLRSSPRLWLQMSTLAIYGHAGEQLVVEGHPPADGPPQMPGVARPWEHAVEGANTARLVIMRTGIVLDRGTPAFDRLTKLTRWGLGGRISSGRQWISWVHIADFLRAVRFLIEDSTLDGIVHVTSPNPIRNGDMMVALRSTLHRPWSPPTLKPLVHVGAWLMHSDAALALTGRRCLPQRLLDAGFAFEHPTLTGAIADLLERPAT